MAMTQHPRDTGSVMPVRRGGGIDVRRWARDPRIRGSLYQIALVAAVAALLYTTVERALSSLAQRGISSGFGFLGHEAGFQISEAMAMPRRLHWGVALVPIGLALLVWSARQRRLEAAAAAKWEPVLRLLAGGLVGAGILAAVRGSDWAAYAPSDSYLVAILAGIANTLRVAAIGCGLAAVFGTVLGRAQLSTNWLLRTLASGLTDFLRNVPLLLIVMFWYALLMNAFPAARSAVDIGGFLFLTNRGVYYPTLAEIPSALWMSLAALAAGYVGLRLFPAARTTLDRRAAPSVVASTLIAATLAGLIVGARWDVPTLQGFNFAGGGAVGPEFTALLVGLVLYHGSFIADVVRSGILSVSPGQWEAGASLGLKRRLILTKIVLPQALRVILPPATLQFLGLTKNTSIGVVIGFPELVSVSRTVLNQTGKAIEVMLIVLVAYLAISLAIAAVTGRYQDRGQIRER